MPNADGINLGGRADVDGAIVSDWGDICAGRVSVAGISNTDASLSGNSCAAFSVLFFSCVFFDTRIIGNLIRRVRGRNTMYSPNMVIKIVTAIDT